MSFTPLLHDTLARLRRPVHPADMTLHAEPSSPTPPVRVGARADGSLVYLVDLPPEALPSVRVQDLARAWEGARDAARAHVWSVPRGLRFQRQNGTTVDLALADRDATCWAGAVDKIVALNTCYGLSLCLRLLALVDLLTRAAWAGPLVARQPDGARVHPVLLRVAANATLTEDARFDEERFQREFSRQGGPNMNVTGACV